jgi:hypothetical protein
MFQLQLLVIAARNSARRCNAPYSIPNVLMDGVQLHLPPINFQYGAFDADGVVTSHKTTYRWIWTHNSTIPDSNSDWIIIINGIKGGTGTIRTGDGFTMKGTGGTAE